MFQKSVLDSFVKSIEESEVVKSYNEYLKYKEKADEIREFKEEEYQDGFLKDIFENCLGYTLKTTNPKDYNLERETKNETDSKKADGAIYHNGEIIGVVELKDQRTKDLDRAKKGELSPVDQGFRYLNSHSKAKYLIVSNFNETRLYINKKTEYIDFFLFDLDFENFKIFYSLFNYQNISNNTVTDLKSKSTQNEEKISKDLYKDFSDFRLKLFDNIVKNNTTHTPKDLLRLTQKLCDRIIFILFAEDRELLRANTIKEIREKHKSDVFEHSLYDYYKIYFDSVNQGNQKLGIPKYNGGLFAKDEILDSLVIDDDFLDTKAQKLSDYDFASEVSVNILGHIFEQSLTDLEELTAKLEDKEFDNKKTKRKKDGVFYTPEYITKYIVENTLGKLCAEKKEELKIPTEIEIKNPKKLLKKEKDLKEKILDYRAWLKDLKILDPACGSGAFLNQALDFLIKEHTTVRDLLLPFQDLTIGYEIEKEILENNLYGVDINEDATEIAKLSLWLRTAYKGRELTKLADKIKTGNSLIDDKTVAENAFIWEEEFPEVFEKGGFDVVIGNPPYLGGRDWKNKETEEFFINKYKVAEYQFDMYLLFWELGINLLKKEQLISYITPNTWLNNQKNSKLRELILTETNILSLVDYSQIDVFEDATVLTTIATLKKSNEKTKTAIYQPINEILKIVNEVEQNTWINNDYFIININLSENDGKILNKIEKSSSSLDTFGAVKFGVKIYQKGKGVPKQESYFSKEKIFESSTKVDETYRKYITGKDIERYYHQWNNTWLKYGKNLAEPRYPELFEGSKILVRRIVGETLVATFVEEDLVINQLLQIVKLENEKLTKTITAILGSKMMIYYFRKKYNRQEKTFPEIRIYELASLPILKNLTPHSNMDKKADLMLDLNKDLQKKKEKFLKRLTSNFQLDKLSKKLENFEDLDFQEFTKELKKKKISLTLKDQDDWEEYFNDYKKEITDLKIQINTTDKEIDKMVYKLYGLTDEEIEIVEGI
ncbi:MAG: N-6 DNA methylase [Campylobacterales bacterium]|nr:N-6 DNA methylase [Campylobacterales bacterium]